MLKGGIIGLGRMGITHFSILKSHPNVDIVAVCDKTKVILRALEKNVGVSTYSSYEDMIEDKDLDFVIVATPSKFHSENTDFALRNNLHVFVEKPFVVDLAQGKKILELLREGHLVNQVGYVYRFNEVFSQVKKILDYGLIGCIEDFKFEMFSRTVLRDSNTGWRGEANLGGGCLRELASHCIDLVVYLIGPPKKVVGSVLKSVYSSSVEDIVSSTLLYNSCKGSIHVNWSDASYRKPTIKIEISGKEGNILADSHFFKLFLKNPNSKYGFKRGWNTRYITDFAKGVRLYIRGNEFTRQLDHFVDCIKKKECTNISSFSQAIKTDIIIEEIIKDNKNKC